MKRNKTNPSELDFSFLHNKYKETEFYQKTLEKDICNYQFNSSVQFYIATTAPQFCESPHDVFRSAIRLSTFHTMEKQLFAYSENMNLCKKNAIFHSKHRRKIKSSHYIIESPTPFKSFISDLKTKEPPKLSIDEIKRCLECDDYSDLKKFSESQIDIPISYDFSQQISSIETKHSVFRQCACSSNTHLFIINDENNLKVYKIYNGLILGKPKKCNLKNLEVNKNTIMFCSVFDLYIKTESNTYKIPLSTFEGDNISSFDTINDFEDNIGGCSDGSSYILFGKNGSITFSNEKITVKYDFPYEKYNVNPNNLTKDLIYLINGTTISIINNEYKNNIITSLLDGSNATQQQLFKEINGEIEAATINSYHEAIFIITNVDGKHIISSYPCKGAVNFY